MEMKPDVTADHLHPDCVTLQMNERYSIPKLPGKVDVRVVTVLGLPGVPPGERAEEGVGEQTCHLLLRHGDGVAHASLEEGYWLKEEERYK